MLPPVMLFCLIGALVFRSAPCVAFVTLTLAAWLLPPGKVGALKELSSGHRKMARWHAELPHEAPNRKTLKPVALRCLHSLAFWVEVH